MGVPVLVPTVGGSRAVIQSETLLKTTPALSLYSGSQDLPQHLRSSNLFAEHLAGEMVGLASLSSGAKILCPQSPAPDPPAPAVFIQGHRQTGQDAKSRVPERHLTLERQSIVIS